MTGRDPSEVAQVFTSMIRSVLEYACEIWHPGLTKQLSDTIEHLQKRAMKICYPDLDYAIALSEAGLETLYDRREARCRKFFQDITDTDHKLNYLLPPSRNIVHLRRTRKYEPPLVRTQRLKNSPINYGLFNFQ